MKLIGQIFDRLGQIAIGIFVIDNTIFDLFHIAKNTHHSVLFFSFMYFTLLAVCINEYLKSKMTDVYSFVMGIGFIVRILWELRKWNLSYDDYMKSVNKFEIGLLFAFLLIALLLGAINYENRNNRNSSE